MSATRAGGVGVGVGESEPAGVVRRPRPGAWLRLAALTASEFSRTPRCRWMQSIKRVRWSLVWFEALAELAGG